MIPLNLGIRAHDLGQCSLTDLCEKLHDYQLTNIQFAIKKSFPEYVNSLTSLSPGIASYFGDYFSQNRIKISVLGCYVNISSRDPAIRKQAIDSFKTHIRLAHDFRSSLVGTETGSVGQGYTTDNFTEEAYVMARSSVIEIVEFAEHFGVTVGIEAGLNHPLYTAELAKRLIDEVQSPNLKIIFDGANLMRPDNYLEKDVVIPKAIELLHDHIAAVHLKDFTAENGKIQIVPVGHGLMDFEPILQFLKYDRPLMHATLEATQGKKIKPAIEYIKEIYEQVLPK